MPADKISLSKKRLILGLTGSIASGKSTLSGLFRKYGVPVIDADKLAHRLLKKETYIYKKIIGHFGKSILKKDKNISRKKLAEVAFKEKSEIEFLNNLVHPAVLSEIKKRLKKIKREIIVIDVPLLFEAGFEKFVDKVIVVKVKKSVALRRFIGRGGKKEDFNERLNLQMPLGEKLRKADFIIDNSGTKSNTEGKLKRILKIINKE